MYVVSAVIAATILVSLPAPLVSVRGLTLTRTGAAVGTAGEPLNCRMELRNVGRLPRYLLELKDAVAGDTSRVLVAHVRGGASESIEYKVENPLRGIYSGGDVTVESAAPFGLFYGRRRLRVIPDIVIYPRTFQVGNLPDPPGSGSSEQYRSDSLYRGSGEEFWGVREYRPGDPAKIVAWRRSARNLATGRLAVLEMAEQTRHPLALALDLDHQVPWAVRELQISAAASIMIQGLREGREVTADAGNQHVDYPEVPDTDSLLTWCAGLQASQPPELECATVEIVPSLRGVRSYGAGIVVLVSCHEVAGTGPWMTPAEERKYAQYIENEGRRVVVLGPDVREPWRVE
ncbi:hypothetical protein BH23ACT11_BH23ACT11_19370 [soil metagenome]